MEHKKNEIFTDKQVIFRDYKKKIKIVCHTDLQVRVILEQFEEDGYFLENGGLPTQYRCLEETGYVRIYEDEKKLVVMNGEITPVVLDSDIWKWVYKHYLDQEWLNCFCKPITLIDLKETFSREDTEKLIVSYILKNWEIRMGWREIFPPPDCEISGEE